MTNSAQTVSNPPRTGDRAAVAVLLAGVSAALHVGKLPPAVPVLQQQLGLSLVQAGFLLSLVLLASMLLGLAAGLLADGAGLRRCMVTGLVLLTAAGLGGALARNGDQLLWLRMAEGLGFLLTTVPAPSLLRHCVAPARVTRILGIWGAYMPFGTALALLLGPLAIAALGWRGWWLLTALLSGLSAWLLLRRVAPDRRPAAAAAGAGDWRWRVRHTWHAAGPWLGGLSFCVYAAQWLAVIGFLPTLYQSAGWSGWLAGALTALVALVNVAGNVAAGRLLSRGVGAAPLLYTGFCAMALGGWLAFAALTEAAPLLRYGGALLFSIVGGLVPGTLFALAPRLASNDRTIATTIGWMQQWSAAGQVAGPPVVAWIASRSGGWQWTWVATGLCCAAGLALAWRIGRQVRA